MRCRFPLALLLLAVAVACAPSEDSNSVMVRMVFPKGDAAAGRQAFIDLKCTVCHPVRGSQGLPAVENKEPGPDLGVTLQGQPRSVIVNSIVAPDHVNVEDAGLWTDLTAEERVWLGPGHVPAKQEVERTPSRMGNYLQVMTVRQLTDLVAYLKSTADRD